MKRILITGGPVFAYLDDVKIITNKFKGGRMAELAEKMQAQYDCEVTYLTAKDSVHPERWRVGLENAIIITHDGIEDGWHVRSDIGFAGRHYGRRLAPHRFCQGWYQ